MKIITTIFLLITTLVISSHLKAQWSLTGNNVTATQFLGTIAGDTDPFVVKTNGVERLRITPGGAMSIGTTNSWGTLNVDATVTRNINLSGGVNISNTRLKSSQWNLAPTDAFGGKLTFITADWDNGNGYGFITASNVASPVVWMYDYGGRNAFTVAKKGYQGTGNTASSLEQALIPLFQVRENGNVGIGTTNPGSYKLAVEGKIGCREAVVTQNVWADFVFSDKYKLKPLSEVEQFINENKHLPDVPSANEILKDGNSLGKTDAILLQKIEELTLYMIDLKKEMDDLKSENKQLKKSNSTLENKLSNSETKE